MNKLTLFYLIIAAVLVGKTATTMYQRSVIIHHGSTVYEMQQEKQALQQKKIALTSELSQKNSLALVNSQADLSNYQPIGQPIVLRAPALASSQL